MTWPAGVVGTNCFAMSTGKFGDAVDPRVRDQLERVGAAQEEVDHVVRLVEQHRGLAPGALLPAPVPELVGDDRIDVRADLRVAQQFDRGSSRRESPAGFVVPCLLLVLVCCRVLSELVVVRAAVVPAKEGIRPGARACERVVLDNDRVVEHCVLLAVRLQSLIRLRPDALRVIDLAKPVAGAAAGAVALVLRAHRLGADVRDLGQ